MNTYQANEHGYYGEFGGAYIPEILHSCVESLRETYLKVLEDEDFRQAFVQLLREEPSPQAAIRKLPAALKS